MAQNFVYVLYQFPRVVVTKYHKLDGLKQLIFVLFLIFWRLEVQNLSFGRAVLSCRKTPFPCSWWFAHNLWCSLA